MKLHELRQLIREEAKRALNEGPTLSSDANNLIKRAKYLLQQISTSNQELSNLKTQYKNLRVMPVADSINKIESVLKSMFPKNAEIINEGDEVWVNLKDVKPGIIWRRAKGALRSYTNYRTIPIHSKDSSQQVVIDEKKFISDLEQKVGLPKSSIVIKNPTTKNLYEIYTFTVALTQNYKKTVLNFPNWPDAMRMAK